MSFNPTPHTVQMKILRHLLHVPATNYASIQKQTDLTSDHFTFHIKRLIESGFVYKTGDSYALTMRGKEYANRMDTEDLAIERQPKVSVALIIERHVGDRREFLFQQRLKSPYYGFWGRLGGKVRWGENLEEAAARELREETGLVATFSYTMLYHKRDFLQETGELLEHKLFIIMHTHSVEGELIERYEGGLNKWMTQDEFLKTDKRFESAHEFVELIDKGETYHARDFYYSRDEY